MYTCPIINLSFFVTPNQDYFENCNHKVAAFIIDYLTALPTQLLLLFLKMFLIEKTSYLTFSTGTGIIDEWKEVIIGVGIDHTMQSQF